MSGTRQPIVTRACGVRHGRLEVQDGEVADSPDLALRVETTAAGALVPHPLDPDETTRIVIGCSELALLLAYRPDELQHGDVIAPLGAKRRGRLRRLLGDLVNEFGEEYLPIDVFSGRAGRHKLPAMGLVLVEGVGGLALTDRRALGIVWSHDSSAEQLHAGIEADTGNGTLTAFSVERQQLNAVDLTNMWFGGGVKRAILSGSCFLTMRTDRSVNRRGEYAPPELKAIGQGLRWFVTEYADHPYASNSEANAATTSEPSASQIHGTP